MKITEYMSRLYKQENGEHLGNLAELINSEFYEQNYVMIGLLRLPSIWGKRNEKEDEIYNNWNSMLGNKLLELTPFRDATFLKTFLMDICEEEQFKYVYNTTLYCYGKKNYDPKYVLLTRRALPSLEDKPEQFWSSEYIGPMNGLSYEIPKGSPHRLHSVIMVTTLDKLEKYGFAINHGGATDGEVMIKYTPFSRNDILFVHKNDKEKSELISYLSNGGKHCDEVLEELKKTADDRQRYYNGINYESIEDNEKKR